ncbi:hypothetical protein ABI59_10260 [Acidobacteria bacterium Mor1]|nr:hypothetical protein ABI59_10260 [Acidobacteria bacterium Mor1]
MAHLKRKLEYSDLEATPDDGKRYELVRGDLLVTPSPRTLHQRVSMRLTQLLHAYCEEHGTGELFVAPTDVILTPQDVFVPDLLVTAATADVTERGIEGAPRLVVEILSPSTQKNDRNIKAVRYAELGVEHFWLVDPADQTFECYRRVDDAFELATEAKGDAHFEPPDWPGLIIDLSPLFRNAP